MACIKVNIYESLFSSQQSVRTFHAIATCCRQLQFCAETFSHDLVALRAYIWSQVKQCSHELLLRLHIHSSPASTTVDVSDGGVVTTSTSYSAPNGGVSARVSANVLYIDTYSRVRRQQLLRFRMEEQSRLLIHRLLLGG